MSLTHYLYLSIKMYVTLYKRCILNNEYNEVIDTTPRSEQEGVILNFYSYFTKYLDTLDSYTFQIEDTYITNEGTLNLPLTLPNSESFFSYNYMRLSYYVKDQHLHETTRYCFIENVDIRNDIAIITYSTDVWHTFSSFMKIRRSYLSRSRVLEYYNTDNEELSLSPYNIPVEYDGNDKLDIIETNLSNKLDLYNIIIEMQIYETKSSGRVGQRYTLTTLFNYDADGTGSGNKKYNFTKAEAIEHINYILLQHGNSDKIMRCTSLPSWWEPQLFYYDISNIYILPSSFNITSAIGYVNRCQLGRKVSVNVYAYDYYLFDELNYTENELFNNKINDGDNFKHFKIGTLFQNKDLIVNGTSINAILSAFSNNYSFKLLFNCQNEIIDITDSFRLDLPFEVIEGETNAQLKMARNLKNLNSIINLGTSVASLQSGGKLFGPSSSYRETIRKNRYSRIADKWGRRNLTSTITRSSTLNNEGNLAEKISSNITDLVENNAPFYSASKGLKVNEEAFLNAKYGICIFSINSDNDAYVTKAIDETGYITYYIGDYDFIKLSPSAMEELDVKQFNFVKCDFIDLYGDFSQSIANTLKAILNDGVKIWYTENV